MKQLATGILIVLAFAGALRADGKAFKSIDRSSFQSLLENEQRAYLSCDGKTQRMLVAIELEWNASGDSNRALWLLPVRGAGADVKLDLVPEVPRVAGYDPRSKVRDAIYGLGALLRATQLWPAPVDVLLFPTLNRARGSMSFGEVERFGLHSEVIEADSLEALQEHLAAKSANISKEELASFAPYFDGRHCIVATWIEDQEEARRKLSLRRSAVFVEFPATELWYPMRATAGYGSELVPVTLYVEGLVALAEYGEVRPVTPRHYRADNQNAGRSLAPWIIDRRQTLDYTVIDFEEPATRFTADFTFAPDQPHAWALATALLPLTETHWYWPIATVVVVSVLVTSGAFAAKIIGQSAKIGALLGISGVLTVVTPYYVLRDAKSATFRSLGDARRWNHSFVFFYSVLVTAASGLLTLLGKLTFG